MKLTLNKSKYLVGEDLVITTNNYMPYLKYGDVVKVVQCRIDSRRKCFTYYIINKHYPNGLRAAIREDELVPQKVFNSKLFKALR